MAGPWDSDVMRNVTRSTGECGRRSSVINHFGDIKRAHTYSLRTLDPRDSNTYLRNILVTQKPSASRPVYWLRLKLTKVLNVLDELADGIQREDINATTICWMGCGHVWSIRHSGEAPGRRAQARAACASAARSARVWLTVTSASCH